jgi:arsenate reductase (thioredoxin)
MSSRNERVEISTQGGKAMKKMIVCFTVWMATLLFTLSVNGQAQDAEKQTEQTPVVIFVCEHGAAKSILSAALFNQLARERGLNLRAIARGTNPDPEISQKVAAGLQADGLAANEPAPKKISKADLVSARRVITFCALPDDYPGSVRVENWDAVLPAIEDYGNARDKLTERISRLLEELKSKQ